jgi:hypothetical protein
VPGDDRLRFDEDERRSPPGPDAGQPDPELTVRLREPQPPRLGSLQHLQLVPQRQHLELERGVRTRRSSQDQEEREEHGTSSPRSVSTIRGNINRSNRNGLFSRHKRSDDVRDGLRIESWCGSLVGFNLRNAAHIPNDDLDGGDLHVPRFGNLADHASRSDSGFGCRQRCGPLRIICVVSLEPLVGVGSSWALIDVHRVNDLGDAMAPLTIFLAVLVCESSSPCEEILDDGVPDGLAEAVDAE